jgi:hypothetical protein
VQKSRTDIPRDQFKITFFCASTTRTRILDVCEDKYFIAFAFSKYYIKRRELFCHNTRNQKEISLYLLRNVTKKPTK